MSIYFRKKKKNCTYWTFIEVLWRELKLSFIPQLNLLAFPFVCMCSQGVTGLLRPVSWISSVCPILNITFVQILLLRILSGTMESLSVPFVFCFFIFCVLEVLYHLFKNKLLLMITILFTYSMKIHQFIFLFRSFMDHWTQPCVKGTMQIKGRRQGSRVTHSV